jgi:hypothetical protein
LPTLLLSNDDDDDDGGGGGELSRPNGMKILVGAERLFASRAHRPFVA